MAPDPSVHTKETDARRGPKLQGTVKNVTELGMHGRRNFLAGRESLYPQYVKRKRKEKEKSLRGNFYSMQ